MAGFTNRGKWKLLDWVFRNTTEVTNFYVALCTNTNPPSATTNTMADVTQIAVGSGYTDGGYALTPGATDFDFQQEDDTNHLARFQIKDIVWNASGTLPISGDGARWAVLTDDNATVNNRIVIAYWDLVSARSVSSGQTLTLQDCELRLTET